MTARTTKFYKRSMIPGGIADKLGNGYEACWTLLQALEVLQGRKDSIRIEPFDEDAGGFEFRVTRGEHTEWHQCKRRLNSGAWTIVALGRQGVLADFARKLAEPNTECFFVSSDPATILKGLSDKARLTHEPLSFQASLNEGEQKGQRDLRAYWDGPPEKEFDWLRRCRIETVSEYSLLGQLEQCCGLLFRDDPGVVVDRLRGCLERHLTEFLTTDDLRRLAEDELGLYWLARLDPTVDGSIVEATKRYISTLRTTVAGRRIQTPSGNAAAETLRNGKQKCLLISGQAGSGKSATIATLIETAQAAGWPVLALRMDRLLDCASVRGVGDAVMGCTENPVGLLGNRHIDRPTLLVIDQVDAVSEASGRATKARDLLFEMLACAELYSELRVAIACRSYDLANDFQLATLAKSKLTRMIEVGPLDWDDAVAPILSELGLGDRVFSDAEKRILSLPLNLHLFAEIALSGTPVEGEISRSRLTTELLRVREREFQAADLSWAPLAPLGAMAAYMSDNQVLSAPESILATFPGALDRLSSGGLIARSAGKVQFTHETLFDHVFAAQFLAQSTPVLDFLLASEQRLFRRTQVRQIFAQLRDHGVDRRYLRNLTEVMDAKGVRHLVKDAIASWLATVESPTSAELKIVLRWCDPSHELWKVAQAILTGNSWLSVLSSSGTIGAWLDQEGEKHDLAFWILRGQTTRNPLQAQRVIAAYWARHPDRTVELLNWFSNLYPDGPIGELEELYAELVGACPPELFQAGAIPPQMRLGSWSHGGAKWSARVLSLWFCRCLEALPDGHPFGRSIDRRQDDRYWIRELANNAPDLLLEAMLPCLAEGMRRDQRALEARTTCATDFEIPSPLERDGLEGYVTFVVDSLKTVARSAPEKANLLLDELPPGLGCTALHVHLETIAANGAALGRRLPALLDHPNLLESGPRGVEWQSFATAARESIPHLCLAQRDRIEQVIAGHAPELDYVIRSLSQEVEEGRSVREIDTPGRRHLSYCLTQTGSAERCALKTIGPTLLSERARRRLAELERKFPGAPLPEPHGVRGGLVGSPISVKAAEKMNDRQWLSAMQRYHNEEGHVFLRGRVLGGCRELANLLKEQVKREPRRFVELIEGLPKSVNGAYVEAIVQGVAESDAPAELAVRALRVALAWPGRGVGRWICWLIQKKPEAGAIPEAVHFLMVTAASGDASDSAITRTSMRPDRRPSVQELLQDDGYLGMNGINGDRGAAYEALASVLWHSEATLLAILPFLEKQVTNEPLASVQACMLRLINSVSKYRPETGIALLLRLAERNLEPLGANSGLHILQWAVYNYPDRLRPLVEQLQRSEVERLRALGLFLLSGMALSDNDARGRLESLWPESDLARQVSAFCAAGHLTSDRSGECASEWAIGFFADKDEDVRREASLCDWENALDPVSGNPRLVDSYVDSKSFEDHSDRLIMALEERIDLFPELALKAVRRVISMLGIWEGQGYQDHRLSVHHLGQMLVNLYRAFEVDPKAEADILDLFDAYLAKNVYGVREAISAYERT